MLSETPTHLSVRMPQTLPRSIRARACKCLPAMLKQSEGARLNVSEILSGSEDGARPSSIRDISPKSKDANEVCKRCDKGQMSTKSQCWHFSKVISNIQNIKWILITINFWTTQSRAEMSVNVFATNREHTYAIDSGSHWDFSRPRRDFWWSRWDFWRSRLAPTISLGSHQNIGLHTGARANVLLLTLLTLRLLKATLRFLKVTLKLI